MEKIIGITKGKWWVSYDHSEVYVQSLRLTISNNWKSAEHEANAKLIADAGNTANKVGLLPSEILEQRNELLRALTACHSSLATYGKHPIIDNQVSNLINKMTKTEVK